MFEDVKTLGDVRTFVSEGYRASGFRYSSWNSRNGPLAYRFRWGELPLALAEPGPLIEHAVKLAGSDGLTLEHVRGVFDRLSDDEFDRGLRFVRQAGMVAERRERVPGDDGRLEEVVVLRHRDHCG